MSDFARLSPGATPIRVAVMPAYLRELVGGGSSGRVVGCYSNALHLAFGADIFALAGSDSEDGPLVLRLGRPWREIVPILRPAPGLVATIGPGGLSVGDVWVPMSPATACWTPRPPNAPRNHAAPDVLETEWTARLAALRSLQSREGREFLSEADRLAPRAVAGLRRWCANLDTEPDAEVFALLGVGSGLTPSGDDVLTGVLLALWELAEANAATVMERALESRLARATTNVSRSQIKAALAGQGPAPLHELIRAILQGPIDAIEPAWRRARALGHSSGQEMIAGALLALEARRPKS